MSNRDGILDPHPSEHVQMSPELAAFDRWAADPNDLAKKAARPLPASAWLPPSVGHHGPAAAARVLSTPKAANGFGDRAERGSEVHT